MLIGCNVVDDDDDGKSIVDRFRFCRGTEASTGRLHGSTEYTSSNEKKYDLIPLVPLGGNQFGRVMCSGSNINSAPIR